MFFESALTLYSRSEIYDGMLGEVTYRANKMTRINVVITDLLTIQSLTCSPSS